MDFVLIQDTWVSYLLLKSLFHAEKWKRAYVSYKDSTAGHTDFHFKVTELVTGFCKAKQ